MHALWMEAHLEEERCLHHTPEPLQPLHEAGAPHLSDVDILNHARLIFTYIMSARPTWS